MLSPRHPAGSFTAMRFTFVHVHSGLGQFETLQQQGDRIARDARLSITLSNSAQQRQKRYGASDTRAARRGWRRDWGGDVRPLSRPPPPAESSQRLVVARRARNVRACGRFWRRMPRQYDRLRRWCRVLAAAQAAPLNCPRRPVQLFDAPSWHRRSCRRLRPGRPVGRSLGAPLGRSEWQHRHDETDRSAPDAR